MKKTVLALALAAAMVGSLTACGGGSKTESTAAPHGGPDRCGGE